MISRELENAKTWFNNYIKTFTPSDIQSAHMIQLKVEHSMNVAVNSRTLAEELKWPKTDVFTAEILGLLHDIGRFSQFAEYGTFTDSNSINHADRGYDVVSQSNILSSLSPIYRQSIFDGILFHNRREIPRNVRPESLPLVKLVRDADKVDIFRVVSESMEDRKLIEYINNAMNLQSNGSINHRALDEIRRKKIVSNENLKSEADFHLMRLSWVFDINYSATFKHIYDKKILEQIIHELPHDDEIQAVSNFILKYLRDHV